MTVAEARKAARAKKRERPVYTKEMAARNRTTSYTFGDSAKAVEEHDDFVDSVAVEIACKRFSTVHAKEISFGEDLNVALAVRDRISPFGSAHIETVPVRFGQKRRLLPRWRYAFEFTTTILIGACADPYAPKVVRSSAGATFAMRTVQATEDETLHFLQAHDYELIGTSSSSAVRADSGMTCPVDLTGRRVAVAIGSEGEGLSETLLTRTQHTWRIRHSSRVESLNAAIAGSIVMKEIYEARHHANG